MPEDGDWKTLSKLGLKEEYSIDRPEYEKISGTAYQLVFIQGFDPPYLLWNSNEKIWKEGFPAIPDKRVVEMVIDLVERQEIVIKEKKLIDSLSLGKRKLSLLAILDDEPKNIYLVKVGEDNGKSFVSYYNFLVDGSNFSILNPSGKLEGQEIDTIKN